MKKQLPGFIAGLLCAVVLFGVTVGAGALITGPTNISVSPINIIVNGEVFQPKGSSGELVDVFNYGGTTYVPLRAIAETFGLQVGWDAEKNLATVNKPESSTPPSSDKNEISESTETNENTSYQDFKKMWTINYKRKTVDNEKLYDARYNGELSKNGFEKMWLDMNENEKEEFAKKMAIELREENQDYTISIDFYYKSTHLGYAFAYSGAYQHSLSSFSPNPFLS